MFRGAKDRAKKKNIIFTISKEDIKMPEICPILKTPFKFGTIYAASLDRKNPDKGYVPGNIWVISRKANVMKNNATLEELERFADWVKTLARS